MAPGDRVGPVVAGRLEELGRRGHGVGVRVDPADHQVGGHLVEGPRVGAVVLTHVDPDALVSEGGGQRGGQGRELEYRRTGGADQPGGGEADHADGHDQGSEVASGGPRRPRTPEGQTGHHGTEPDQAPGAALQRGRVPIGSAGPIAEEEAGRASSGSGRASGSGTFLVSGARTMLIPLGPAVVGGAPAGAAPRPTESTAPPWPDAPPMVGGGGGVEGQVADTGHRVRRPQGKMRHEATSKAVKPIRKAADTDATVT